MWCVLPESAGALLEAYDVCHRRSAVVARLERVLVVGAEDRVQVFGTRSAPRDPGATRTSGGGDGGTRTHDPLLAKHARCVVITAHRHENPYKHSDLLPVSSQ
jgi:hypothetical protein